MGNFLNCEKFDQPKNTNSFEKFDILIKNSTILNGPLVSNAAFEAS
jgi:hypothetical protein